MPRVANPSDPRVQRTRQLLLDTFNALVVEKHNLHSISIREIAARANVNRATFYAHFEDKYALVADWMCAKFRRTLAFQLPAGTLLQRETLYQFILTLFDFLALGHRYHSPTDKEFEPLFEVVLQGELYIFLLNWLKQSPSAISCPVETLETTVQVISWAIFGPAVRWSLGDRRATAEEMSQRVLTVVIAGLSPVITVI